jgi:hypothetical protein
MSSRPAGTRPRSCEGWKKKRALSSRQRFCALNSVTAGSCPSSAWPLTMPIGLLSRMVTWLACWPWACRPPRCGRVFPTCMPMVATWPLTLTQPLAIQSSASRREPGRARPCACSGGWCRWARPRVERAGRCGRHAGWRRRGRRAARRKPVCGQEVFASWDYYS